MNNDTHDDDFESLRHLLQARRRELMENLHRRLQRIRQTDVHATSVGEGEEDDTSEIDIDMGVVEIMNATVTRIDAALVRLTEGEYGRCARCHGPIGEARLRAMPFAVCCHNCETRRERSQAATPSRLRRSSWDADGPVAVATRDEI